MRNKYEVKVFSTVHWLCRAMLLFLHLDFALPVLFHVFSDFHYQLLENLLIISCFAGNFVVYLSPVSWETFIKVSSGNHVFWSPRSPKGNFDIFQILFITHFMVLTRNACYPSQKQFFIEIFGRPQNFNLCPIILLLLDVQDICNEAAGNLPRRSFSYEFGHILIHASQHIFLHRRVFLFELAFCESFVWLFFINFLVFFLQTKVTQFPLNCLL